MTRPSSRIWRRAIVGCLVCMSLGVASAAAATASGPYVDGIADQNLGLWNGNFADAQGVFDEPFYDYFQQAWVGTAPSQHIRYARFVTAPDAITQGGACEQNLFNWYSYVTNTLHLIPVIAVWDVAEGGCANHGVPSSANYTADIQQLVTALGGVGGQLPYLEAWNEPNDSGVSAAAAAAFWADANSVCAAAGCTALAGDYVDTADQSQKFNASGCATNLTFNNLKTYAAGYVKGLKGATPAIWALHPYLAVNCRESSSISAVTASLPASATPAQVWFTEVGGWECALGQSPPRGTAVQQADASYLVNTLMVPPAPHPPTNVFWYELAAPGYTQNCAKYADSALYEANTAPGFLLARPAAQTIYGPDTELSATTSAPTSVSSTQATLNGTEVPGGIYEGSYYFKYGRTTAYGSQTPTVSLGPGLSAEAVSATVSGLSAFATYHYELVAVDTAGTTKPGGDQRFSTPLALPPARGR
ncbi:MAG TPA: hypothetical protein VGG41_20970 [Solirubrobacteraceae bacterium]